MIDPVERDIVQNIYIRRVEKVDGKLRQRRHRHDPDGEGSVEDRQSAEAISGAIFLNVIRRPPRAGAVFLLLPPRADEACATRLSRLARQRL